MNTVWLLNLYNNKLYSLEQYKIVLQQIVKEYPELAAYCGLYTLLLFGDHPTFINFRKMLAHLGIPIFILSQLGKFHIWLNLVEQVGKLFWHFLDAFHHTLFGSHLPLKPKFNYLVLLLTIIMTSWMTIRDRILQHFKISKDLEYTSALFFLEEVTPICVLLYSVVFRSNNLAKWEQILGRIEFLFINFKRIRYDKATLCMITDNIFFKTNHPEFYNKFAESHSYQTEIKVEQFHGIIRRNTQPFLQPEEIIKIAQCLGSKELRKNFNDLYESEWEKKPYRGDYGALVEIGVLHLSTLFRTMANNIGHAKVIIFTHL